LIARKDSDAPVTIFYDFMGHMISDTSIEELHEFAQRINLRVEWFQNKGAGKFWIPHYDLTTPNARKRAKLAGATEIDPTKLVEILKSAPYKDKWEDYIGQGMS
jgi:hypothetical protein